MTSVISHGKICYKDSMNKKNLIRLKTQIIALFPELSKLDCSTYYKIEYHHTYKSLLRCIIEIIEKKAEMPLILTISSEEKHE